MSFDQSFSFIWGFREQLSSLPGFNNLLCSINKYVDIMLRNMWCNCITRIYTEEIHLTRMKFTLGHHPPVFVTLSFLYIYNKVCIYIYAYVHTFGCKGTWLCCVGRQEYTLGVEMGLHPGVDASHQHPVVQVRLKTHTHTQWVCVH